MNKPFPTNEAMNNALVQVLKEIRTNTELSQSDLEAKLNVGTEYISKIERGKIKVSLNLLRKYSIVFTGLTVSDILKRAEKYAKLY